MYGRRASTSGNISVGGKLSLSERFQAADSVVIIPYNIMPASISMVRAKGVRIDLSHRDSIFGFPQHREIL
jgi:hypothetical protein